MRLIWSLPVEHTILSMVFHVAVTVSENDDDWEDAPVDADTNDGSLHSLSYFSLHVEPKFPHYDSKG